jgi:hypothetical protein
MERKSREWRGSWGNREEDEGMEIDDGDEDEERARRWKGRVGTGEEAGGIERKMRGWR